MGNKGLLFIPDISGFTRFVNETEVEHSRLIIQELLEILINSNELDLVVSEVEGDAILFYKYGPIPGLEELYKQVQKMFCSFHKSLIAYDHRRYCQCKACMSAVNLSLKIITHYGEFTGYNVKQFSKLIGKDVIVAHQLLKNDIDVHEYWLVTNSILDNKRPAGLASWMTWDRSRKETDSGEIPFYYTLLSELKNEIPPDPLPAPVLLNKSKVFSVSREYDTDIITLFHATGDFNFRARWLEGAKNVEEVNHFLPRVGMKCRCIFESGQVITYSASYTYTDEKIEFGEVEENSGNVIHYTLEKLGRMKSRLTIDYYIPKNLLKEFSFRLNKKAKLEKIYQQSIKNLDQLVKEVQLPVTEE